MSSSIKRSKGRLYSIAATGLAVFTVFLHLVVSPISTPLWTSLGPLRVTRTDKKSELCTDCNEQQEVDVAESTMGTI